jgi:SpoVK/Ycf46/Vps4 family AAA+-type ATPase
MSGEFAEKSSLVNLLGPMTIFEVPLPNGHERYDIWEHLMCKHISMSALDIVELVKLSSGLPRCDIFAAAREAVAQAFHKSIEELSYVPVSRSNMLDKIAAYQPLDSEEYRAIEDSVAEDFLDEIERYDRGEI